MDIELISAIISFIALAIAIFSMAIAFVFYFKTSELYTKMLTTLVKIETISNNIYSGTYDLIKDAWPHLWESESSKSIISKRDEVYHNMKEEILEKTKDNIKKNIESIKIKGVDEEELKKKLSKLEEKVTDIANKMFNKRDELEKIGNLLRQIEPSDLKFLKYIYLRFRESLFSFSKLYSKVKVDLQYSKSKTIIIVEKLIAKGLLETYREGRMSRTPNYYLTKDVIELLNKFKEPPTY